MRSNLLLHCLILLKLSIISQVGLCQQMNLPPSPKLVALAENNVNLINGTPIIKVPITEISTSSMKVPIFLSYNAKGNKVSSIASSVGLSWTLNLLGELLMITTKKIKTIIIWACLGRE